MSPGAPGSRGIKRRGAAELRLNGWKPAAVRERSKQAKELAPAADRRKAVAVEQSCWNQSVIVSIQLKFTLSTPKYDHKIAALTAFSPKAR